MQAHTEWPICEAPPPALAPLNAAAEADSQSTKWTELLDTTFGGWEMQDLLTIFEEDDDMFAKWHAANADKCAALGFLFCARLRCAA